jgi:DNA-binding protein YbaB
MNYNKAISEIKKYQSNVEKEYKALKNSIEEMQKTNYKDGKSSVSILFPGEETPINVTYSNELMNSINTWCKAKVNQVQEITNIHSLAFSAKLDAVNNCYKQDKAVLYQALNNMQKTTKIKEDAELSYIFGKNEQPEIKVSDSLVNYKDKGELYDTPLKDDDIKEKEPARISQFSSLIKDLKLK